MKTDHLITLLAQDVATHIPDSRSALMQSLPVGMLMTIAVFLAVLGIRPDIATAVQATGVKLTFGGLLAVTAGYGAMALVRPDSPGARHALPVGIAVLFLCGVMFIDRSWAESAAGAPVSILKCLVAVPLLAMFPLAAFLVALRRGAVASPALAGGLAGFASAGLAILAYGLNCNEDSPLFIMMWYGLAAAITAAAGAIAGRRTLVW